MWLAVRRHTFRSAPEYGKRSRVLVAALASICRIRITSRPRSSRRSGGSFDGNPLSSGTTALGTAIKLFYLGNAGLIARHAIVAQFQKRSHPHHVAPLAPGPGGFGPSWVDAVEKGMLRGSESNIDSRSKVNAQS